MPRVLADYFIAVGWGVVGAVSLAFGLGILLRVLLTPIDEWEEIRKGNISVAVIMAAVMFDWLTPIDEWEEIRKGNISVAVIMAAVILALGIAIGFAIMPVPAAR